MIPTDAELLRRLDDEPPTMSTVDVPRAIADGRRQRRRRRAAGYAGIAVVTALAVTGVSVTVRGKPGHPPPGVAASTTPKAKAKPAYAIPGTPGWKAAAATAPTSCTLQQLPAAGNAQMAIIGGADPAAGYLVGRSYPKGNGYSATVWHDGHATGIPLPGDEEEDLEGVNAAGTAVGWSYHNDKPVPYVYRAGKVAKLPGVRNGYAHAINTAGAIAGEDLTGDAVVWPSATAQPIRLPRPKNASAATANAIDEDGTVVGTVDSDWPYVWFADGTSRALPMPLLDGETATSAQATGIRNGWVIGSANMGSAASGPAARMWPVRWNLRTGEVKATSAMETRPDAVNPQGWQVGTNKKGQAVLITGTSTVILPGLIAPEPEGLTTIPNTLSDDGRTIAGQADDANGVIRPVIWRCH